MPRGRMVGHRGGSKAQPYPQCPPVPSRHGGGIPWWGGGTAGRGRGAEGSLVPAHSPYLLCKSEFIISQEIINCWADKRHRSAPPGTPSKGAVRGWRDKLWLRSPSPSGLGGNVPPCPFDGGSPRVWLPPDIPWGHWGGPGWARGWGDERAGPCPVPRFCLPHPSFQAVSLCPTPSARRGVPPGAGGASGGRFPPHRHFRGDCGASAHPGSRRSNYRGRAGRQMRSAIAPTAGVKFPAN